MSEEAKRQEGQMGRWAWIYDPRFGEIEMKETEFALFGTRFWYLRAKAEKA